MEQEIAERFENLYPKVFRYAVSRTKNKDAAHDVIMDVYTKILEKFRADGELPEQLEFYTIRAIRNRHIDVVRASQKVDYIEDHDGYLEPIDETLPSDPFMKKRIARAFSQLGDACQETLGLIAQGWKYRDIQELTGKPLNTVAGTVFKCRAKFKFNLYGEDQNSEKT